MRGVAAVKPGNTTGHIGAAIQTYAERERCSVVRDFCGHGLGRVFHDRPNILHYGEPGDGVMLEPGMLFTIEPMINLGKPHVKILPDGWTAVTRDRELSAQFEHTVGVTETRLRGLHVSRPRACTARPTSPPETRSGARDGRSIEGPRRHPRDACSNCRYQGRRGGTACGPPAAAQAALSPTAGPRRCRTTSCSSSLLFSAIPRRDTKPIAKRLLQRFGSFAEVINAPAERLKEVQGRRRCRRHAAEAGARRRAAPDAEGHHAAPGADVMDGRARLLPRRHGLRGARAVPHPVPRQEEPPDRRRDAAARHRGPHAGLCARGGQAGAGAARPAPSSWSTTTPRATRPPRGPTST